jgi:predicted HTH transcriptional regulator
MFPTSLSGVTATDIHSVVDTEATERNDFELKKALPSDSGADPWMTGGKIGDRAKDELTTEMVAFANTSGGTLIVGIGEDSQTKAAKKPLSALAVLRLIPNSNLVDCITGRSAGFSPMRIRPT